MYESISRKNGYYFILEKLRLFERVNINTKFTFQYKFFFFLFEKFKLSSNPFFRLVLVFSGLRLLSLPHCISPWPWPSICISWIKSWFCVSQSQPPICISWFPFGSWSLICFLTMKAFQASFKLFIDSLILDFAFLNYFFKKFRDNYFSIFFLLKMYRIIVAVVFRVSLQFFCLISLRKSSINFHTHSR